MAIAFDASSTSGIQASSSNYTFSHTCTGGNLVLLVGISMLAPGTVNSVTYNSVAMTKEVEITDVAAQSSIWSLINPATGANDVEVTFDTAIGSITNALSFTGANQFDCVEAANSANASGSDSSLDVVTVSDNAWVIDLITTSDTSITVGTGQTERINTNVIIGSSAMSTKGPVSPAASTNMSWTGIGVSNGWITNGVSLREAKTKVMVIT